MYVSSQRKVCGPLRQVAAAARRGATRGDTIPEESRFTIPDFRGIGPLRGGPIPQKESVLYKELRFTIHIFEESYHL